MNNIKFRLVVMNFLEFAVWGAYLISLGQYLASVGLGDQIKWFYTVQGLVSIFMPAIVGIIADRYIPAQKMMSLCHLFAALGMGAAGWYAMSAGDSVEFGPLFTFYTISVAFFMPTIGLGNSVAFNSLTRNGLDTVKHFPPIRVFGTVGFICSMLFVNFTGFQFNYMQLFTSAALSILLALYSLTLPDCGVSREKSASLADSLGLRAFSLFKERRMAVFFIFSMLLGVSLQITNGYGSTFINSFKDITEFAGDWGVRNATAIISISQMSEALCILLIPFCLKRFGIKGVMLTAMVGWVLRFGFFGLGNPGSGVWLIILSCIVYGVAFDFFNVSGGLYVDRESPARLRSSAQGLFMLMTNGIGASIGTFVAGEFVVNRLVFAPGLDAMERWHGWQQSWFIFAAYALIVAVLFVFIFKDSKSKSVAGERKIAADTAGDPEGFVEQ